MYKEIAQTEVPEINGTIIEYEHEKTGAHIIKMRRNTPSFSYGDISRNKVSV